MAKDSKDISTIIKNINIKNGKELFDLKHISDDVRQLLLSLGRLSYVGHGVMSVCFARNSHEVVKLCYKKRKEASITSSREIFLAGVKKLIDNDLSILAPLAVIFENDNWLIYTQPLCKVVSASDVSPKLCCEILDQVEIMLKTNIRLSDIYYRNFGIYQNKLCLFDFHEIDDFSTSPNFIMTNLYSLFTALGKVLGWGVCDLTSTNTAHVIADDFGKGRFPEAFVGILQSLYNRQYEDSKMHIQTAKNSLKRQIPKKYDKYQHVSINEQGSLDLSSHTLCKYNITEDIINQGDITTVLDARCCIGGVGLKICQEFPDVKVYLSNVDSTELNKTRKIANSCMIFNSYFLDTCVTDIKPAVKYDLVLYLSLFHHLLKNYQINELLNIVKVQTGKYCLIEVPVFGDNLLEKVIKSAGRDKKDHFKCLSSPETFRYHLAMNKLQVNKCIRVDYGGKNLIRYAFICSV